MPENPACHYLFDHQGAIDVKTQHLLLRKQSDIFDRQALGGINTSLYNFVDIWPRIVYVIQLRDKPTNDDKIFAF